MFLSAREFFFFFYFVESTHPIIPWAPRYVEVAHRLNVVYNPRTCRILHSSLDSCYGSEKCSHGTTSSISWSPRFTCYRRWVSWCGTPLTRVYSDIWPLWWRHISEHLHCYSLLSHCLRSSFGDLISAFVPASLNTIKPPCYSGGLAWLVRRRSYVKYYVFSVMTSQHFRRIRFWIGILFNPALPGWLSSYLRTPSRLSSTSQHIWCSTSVDTRMRWPDTSRRGVHLSLVFTSLLGGLEWRPTKSSCNVSWHTNGETYMCILVYEWGFWAWAWEERRVHISVT